MRSLIEMITIKPMMTMRTIVKYRLGQALVQLASDTVMFLGIMHSAANQGVRELAATMLWEMPSLTQQLLLVLDPPKREGSSCPAMTADRQTYRSLTGLMARTRRWMWLWWWLRLPLPLGLPKTMPSATRGGLPGPRNRLLPIVAESLCGWHTGAKREVKRIGAARHTEQEEGEAISHLWGRLAYVMLQLLEVAPVTAWSCFTWRLYVQLRTETKGAHTFSYFNKITE